METPHFDEAIDMYGRMQVTSSEGEKLREYKAIKKALSIHSVSYSVAQQYAEFCVRCDRDNLPLIKIEDYLKQL